MNDATTSHREERRAVLKAGAGMAVGAALGGLGLDAAAAGLAEAATSSDHAIAVAADAQDAWSNWSGIEYCSPQVMSAPGNEAELADVLARSNGGIRCVGAGHSFSALVPTDTTLISLDRMSHIGKVDTHAQTVNIQAGIRLASLSRQLDIQGSGLRNLPDIDTQSYAGAIATGTHGTGKAFQALHADTVALRIMTSEGETVECSETINPDLLAAARVSLGCLGVVTQATLRVVPTHNLHRRVYLRPVQDMLDETPALADKHRNFEFYYLPHTGYAVAIVHDLFEGRVITQSPSAAEDVLADLRRLRDWFGWFPALRRMVANWTIDPDQTEEGKNRSWKLLSSHRPSKFNESEFHLPQAHGIDCMREVITALEQRDDTYFPVEFRFVKGDDAWLSPFYQRDSCSIAVHAAQGEPYDYLVSQIGPIFRKHEGRPHWGKLHDLSASELARLYPRWKDFLEVREQLDPKGRMLNRHTRQLFGLAA